MLVANAEGLVCPTRRLPARTIRRSCTTPQVGHVTRRPVRASNGVKLVQLRATACAHGPASGAPRRLRVESCVGTSRTSTESNGPMLSAECERPAPMERASVRSMTPRRLAATDMYGLSGSIHRRRVIGAEFFLGAAAGILTGLLILALATTWLPIVIGVWTLG